MGKWTEYDREKWCIVNSLASIWIVTSGSDAFISMSFLFAEEFVKGKKHSQKQIVCMCAIYRSVTVCNRRHSHTGARNALRVSVLIHCIALDFLNDAK